MLVQFIREDTQLPTATLSIDRENEFPRVQTSSGKNKDFLGGNSLRKNGSDPSILT